MIVADSLGAGGTERFASVLSSELAKLSYDVSLVTLEPTAGDHFVLHPDVRRLRVGVERPRKAGLARRLFKYFETVRNLRGVVRTSQPDVIVALGWSTNVLTLASTALLDVPIIVSERTDPREHGVGLWRVAQRITYLRADQLVVQTAVVGRVMRRWVRPGRISVIPNPVPASAFEAVREPAAVPTICAVGRLDSVKGFDVLIRALSLVRERMPATTLILVGEGPMRRDLEELAAALRVTDAVTFTGLVDDPSLIVRTAWCSCLPSRFEGFPNALIEAMALGVPVVATDCRSGPSEILGGSAGILVPVDDPAALGRALTEILADCERADALGAAARRRARAFEAGPIVERWTDLFSRLDQRRRRAGDGDVPRCPGAGLVGENS